MLKRTSPLLPILVLATCGSRTSPFRLGQSVASKDNTHLSYILGRDKYQEYRPKLRELGPTEGCALENQLASFTDSVHTVDPARWTACGDARENCWISQVHLLNQQTCCSWSRVNQRTSMGVSYYYVFRCHNKLGYTISGS